MLFDERKSILALFCKKNSRIFEYELSTAAGVSLSDYYGFLINRFKAEGNCCLISGKTLYLQRPLQWKVTFVQARSRFLGPADITVTFRCEIPLKTAKNFFNCLFGKIVDHLNDSGDPQELSSLNDSKIYNLQMFQGLWSSNVMMIRPHENGVFLKFDVNYKLVGQRSVYDFIQQELEENRHRHNPLDLVRKLLIGKTIMTRYDNKVYVIDDIDFESSPSDPFQNDDEKLLNFADFYKQKYKIETRHMRQPMLINRVQFTNPSTGEIKCYVRCLIPEFCYPVYAEWNPMMEPKTVFTEFLKSLRHFIKARELLTEWKISFDKFPVPPLIKRVSLVDVNSEEFECRSIVSNSSYRTALTHQTTSIK